MKCLKTKSEFLRKCFLLCKTLPLLLLLTSCASDPVYIADEIDVNDLWTYAEHAVTTEMTEESKQNWDGVTVYYTESGTVWHKSADCSALKKSKNVIVGTQDEANAAGKERACKKCG